MRRLWLSNRRARRTNRVPNPASAVLATQSRASGQREGPPGRAFSVALGT